MSCFNKENNYCGCNFNIRNFGVNDLSNIRINGADRTALNWSEISVPEILKIPELKPDIENLDQIYVDAKITNVKLIETPYSYTVYDRLGTAYEIAETLTALALAVVDITPIVNAVNAILAIPGLPAIPLVQALQDALNAVTSAAAVLTNAITAAVTALNAPCIAAVTISALVNAVIVAINTLIAALQALKAVGTALAAATAAIPVVGLAVDAAVAILNAAIDLVISTLQIAITALEAIITLLGNTEVFVINSNEEDTCLSGRKLIVEGVLKQKVVYTGLVTDQSVHSACYNVPFYAYVIPYAKFIGIEYLEDIDVLIDPATCLVDTVDGFAYTPGEPIEVDLCEEFDVQAYIEDIFTTTLDERTIFKNVTLFFKASTVTSC